MPPATTESPWQHFGLGALIVFAAALPHSIALAQIAVGLALALWIGGHLARRKRLNAIPLVGPILCYLLVSTLAAIFSLEPLISVPKLRGVALVLIVPLVAESLRTSRQAILLISVLLLSASVSASFTWWEKIVGKGVEIVGVRPGSPLQTYFQPRDIVLSCGGEEIESPAHFEQLLVNHTKAAALQCRGLRGGILPFATDLAFDERFPPPTGEAWGYQVKTGRTSRARGRYSHYVTYAEVMLQLAALAAGLWLACRRKWSRLGVGWLVVTLLLAGALGATFTRASWVALAFSGFLMLWLKLGWRGRAVALATAGVAVFTMNALLVELRGVGFYDPADISLQYRRMMWEDGLRLIGEHPWLGIGMDASLGRWQDLGLRAYERFQLHSHFHSTPVQLAVERGLLGLAGWLLLMGAYLRTLLQLVRRAEASQDRWGQQLGIGILGATAGFLASGLFHYNFGDSEVVMVFWLLAGVAVAYDTWQSSSVATD